MAKVTLVITDNEHEDVDVDLIPDPDFKGDANDLTLAQELSMKALQFLVGDTIEKPKNEPLH